MTERISITNQVLTLRRNLTREQCHQVFNELMNTEGIHRRYNRDLLNIHDDIERTAVFTDPELGGFIFLQVSDSSSMKFTGISYTFPPKSICGMDDSRFISADETHWYFEMIMTIFGEYCKSKFTTIPADGWEAECIKHTIPVDMAVLGNVPASHYLHHIGRGDLIPSGESDYYKTKRSVSISDEEIMIIYTYEENQAVAQIRSYLDHGVNDAGEFKTRELLLFEAMFEFFSGDFKMSYLADECGESAIFSRYAAIVGKHPFRKMKDNLAIIQERREMINAGGKESALIDHRFQTIDASDLDMAERWLNTVQKLGSVYCALKSFDMTHDDIFGVNHVIRVLDSLGINPVSLPDDYQRNFLLNPLEEWSRYIREENN